MIVVTVLILAVAALGYWFQAKQAETTLNNTIGAYENSLAWERTRVDNLLVQVQANSQGFQHYPTYGPAPEVEESTLVDDFGFDTGLLESDDDRDFVPAATV